MTRQDPIARLEGFEKWYGPVRGAGPVDLEIAAGEVLALLGPNGGGKTTVLRAMVGLHAATAGRILIGGHDIAREPGLVRQMISYVPQKVSMPGMLSGREILCLFARLKGVSQERVEEVLEMFALSSDADRFTREYSGGMLQRLGLAIAFLKDVPLYILDEPTLNVDSLGVEILQDHLDKLRRDGRSVLFSSHSLHYAAQAADRVAVLVDGRVAKIEDVSVFQETVANQVMVSVSLTRTSPEIFCAAQSAGAEITLRNGRRFHFSASPGERLEVFRAIENAGGVIEEFHTEAPDWDAIARSHFEPEEERDE
jgi:ABC-type multidrug transport system ATPase subunit